MEGWDESGRGLPTARAGTRHKGGVSSAQARVGNVGTSASMRRETSEWRPHEEPSTDARSEGRTGS